MGSGCITKWAGVGYVAWGGSLLFCYLLRRGRVSSFSFTYILLNTHVVNVFILFRDRA